MPKRKKQELVTCDLTTAAKLIDVDVHDLIQKLHENFILSRNGHGQNIANTTMVNLGYFQNELMNHNGSTHCQTFELVKATHWGMAYLRDFCREQQVKTRLKTREKPKLKLADNASQARKECHSISESLVEKA